VFLEALVSCDFELYRLLHTRTLHQCLLWVEPRSVLINPNAKRAPMLNYMSTPYPYGIFNPITSYTDTL